MAELPCGSESNLGLLLLDRSHLLWTSRLGLSPGGLAGVVWFQVFIGRKRKKQALLLTGLFEPYRLKACLSSRSHWEVICGRFYSPVYAKQHIPHLPFVLVGDFNDFFNVYLFFERQRA